jgi:uncharacterized protein (TIGR02246 family)
MQKSFAILAGCMVLSVVAAGCARKDTDEKDDSAKVATLAGPVDTKAAEAEIRSADTAYFNAVKAKDAAAIAALYSSDAISSPPNSPPLNGNEAIRKSNEEFLKMPQVAMTGGATLIKFSDDGTMGYEIGTYSMTAADAKGKPIKDEGKYLNIWRKVDGKWKIVADSYSSNLAPPKP